MSLESVLRNRYRKLKGFLMDSHTTPYKTYKMSAPTKIMKTMRYRAAARDLPLTSNEKNIVKYKDIYQDRRVWIIGNGPSLNKIDMRLLKDEITFGVNSIFLNYDKMGFLPTHYVVEDIFVAEDRAREISKIQGPQKWFGNYLRYCLEDSPDVNWLNVRMRYDNYRGFPYFSKNAARQLWTGGTVSYLSMQLAYYMGAKEVYLIGFDHSYDIPEDAKVKGTEIISESDDPNHFHPDYFGKGYRWHDPMVDRMELSYIRAKEVYERNGRRVYNATAGGHLEVFSRVNFDDLF